MDILTYVSDLRWLHASLHHGLHMAVQGTPLKGYHMIFLLHLSEKGPMTSKELSEAVEVDKGHVSRAVNELLNEGYVARTGPSRTSPLALTDIGRATAASVEGYISGLLDKMARTVPQQDMASFMEVLHKLAQALKCDAGPMPPRMRHMRKEKEE